MSTPIAGFCVDIDGDWWNGHGPGSGCRYCDSDTPRPPMTQSEPVLEPSRGSICVCGLAKSYHGPPTNLADSDHEYEPRYPARRATQSPVQPVLSGLGALEREWLGSTPPAGHPLIHGIFQRLPGQLARLAATAPAADEAYNAAISDAQQVLSDMPGISDNDGSQPRPEPDYIERAEAVAEVEKLRR